MYSKQKQTNFTEVIRGANCKFISLPRIDKVKYSLLNHHQI